MKISKEDWIKYRENATNYLEEHMQSATRKAVLIAIDKQIPVKANRVEVQPYFRKHFADRYVCPICHSELNKKWNGCPFCLQAIDFGD